MASLNEDCRTAGKQMKRRYVAYQGATGAVEAVGYNFKTYAFAWKPKAYRKEKTMCKFENSNEKSRIIGRYSCWISRNEPSNPPDISNIIRTN